MKKSKKEVSREVGLEIGAICSQYFLKTEHLHYGYWPKGLKIDVTNLHIAQDEYAKMLFSHIPQGVRTILDVGCGTGRTARMLIDAGYKVDCVSPSAVLAKRAAELLPEKSNMFQCLYEDLNTTNKYDMVLFCESFQYIDPLKAVSKTAELLNGTGCLLICDIFKKNVEGKCIIGGGHKLNGFFDVMTNFSFKQIEDIDITDQTAPNIDLLDDVLKNVVQPVVNEGVRFFQSRYPLVMKILRWKYKKKINRLSRKYFSSERTAEDFKKFKSYRLFLYQKT